MYVCVCVCVCVCVVVGVFVVVGAAVAVVGVAVASATGSAAFTGSEEPAEEQAGRSRNIAATTRIRIGRTLGRDTGRP